MKKNHKDSKREPLPGSPEARPEGGRSQGDTANLGPNDARKSGKQNKADSVADDDGMPTATKKTNRDA